MRLLKVAIFLLVLFLLMGISFALNPKSVSYAKVSIESSGSLQTKGVHNLTLSIYIPQQPLESIEVSSDDWTYTNDSYGNKMVELFWEKPAREIFYSVNVIVKNNASYLTKEKKIGFQREEQTNMIKINDRMREIAYWFDRSLEGAAKMNDWVNNYITYDMSLASTKKNSLWVLENKKGVCTEYAILLTALMRAKHIPTRYVLGYAYSNIQNKFVGHAWVEVRASDGSWIEFDPTWNQVGYLDATHIRTAAMPDANQSEKINYFGGTVQWNRNEEKIEILEYSEESPISLFVNGEEYIETRLKGNCSLIELTVKSCVDEKGNELFTVYKPERSVWFCDSHVEYWVFDSRPGNYLCPIKIISESGEEKTLNLEPRENKELNIMGPSTVSVGQKFTLEPEVNGLFFSPEFGENSGNWNLEIKQPGTYDFFLYSDGIGKKTVNVVEKKEFELDMEAPKNISKGDSFLVTAYVENLGNNTKMILAGIRFGDYKDNKTVVLESGVKEEFIFNLTSQKTGSYILVFQIEDQILYSKSQTIDVYEKNDISQGLLENLKKLAFEVLYLIRDFVLGFLDSI